MKSVAKRLICWFWGDVSYDYRMMWAMHRLWFAHLNSFIYVSLFSFFFIRKWSASCWSFEDRDFFVCIDLKLALWHFWAISSSFIKLWALFYNFKDKECLGNVLEIAYTTILALLLAKYSCLLVRWILIAITQITSFSSFVYTPYIRRDRFSDPFVKTIRILQEKAVNIEKRSVVRISSIEHFIYSFLFQKIFYLLYLESRKIILVRWKLFCFTFSDVLLYPMKDAPPTLTAEKLCACLILFLEPATLWYCICFSWHCYSCF